MKSASLIKYAMYEVQDIPFDGVTYIMDCNRLPSSSRKAATDHKYAEAVEAYSSTELPLCRIAEKFNVSHFGLSSYIRKYHRHLLFERYGIEVNDENLKRMKVKPPKGQTHATHLKYKDAINACGDLSYIDLNVSQIGRIFNVNGSCLAAQLRAHYPDIIPNREKLRQRLGIADNSQRGARPSSKKTYSEALELYRKSNMTVAEVADKCNVSKSGFRQFLRFYHKDVLSEKEDRRKAAKRKTGNRTPGSLAGNGNLYGPRPETVALYSEALELYRTESLTIDEIIKRTGVPSEGFKGYLHQWHRGEKLRRRGYEWDGVSDPDLKGTKQYLKSTAAKYAPAISSLKSNPRPVASVAREFGLNGDVFRNYLKTHEPELASQLGMIVDSNGNRVKRNSAEKYSDAIREYVDSSVSLKEIAQKHGLVYKSLCGYITRHCPDIRTKRKEVITSSLNNNI